MGTGQIKKHDIECWMPGRGSGFLVKMIPWANFIDMIMCLWYDNVNLVCKEEARQ